MLSTINQGALNGQNMHAKQVQSVTLDQMYTCTAATSLDGRYP
jgi:hypothetical protein